MFRSAAENWNNANQGHAKELFFLAPCTVEEARRDAGQSRSDTLWTTRLI
jgi:hypothetical protein